MDDEEDFEQMSSADQVIWVAQRSVFTSFSEGFPTIYLEKDGGMMDSSANFCITNNLSALVDVTVNQC